MSETKQKVPKFLQEREGPSASEKAKEKAKQLRKRASHKMGLFATYPLFYNQAMYYNELKPRTVKNRKGEKQKEAYSFASSLHETYHQLQVEKLRKLGSLAMTAPGLNHIGQSLDDRRGSRNRQKERRKQYIERNGTVKSRMRERLIDHNTRFPDDKLPTTS